MAKDHPILHHPLSNLFTPHRATTRRTSSWDRSGANQDFIRVEPGSTSTLMEHEGPGCITHLYCAMILPDLRDYRNGILRCYWDGATDPAVEVPVGDFFGLVHGRAREYSSAVMAVNAGFGSSHGLNSYFPMPFSTGARVTIENRGPTALGGPIGAFWFHVEYETYDEAPGEVHRFHSGYRQERPTQAVGDIANIALHDAENATGDENYVALDTQGEGRMVGLVLEIENVHGPVWYGEGDDMVFIDGEVWPPSIHGTGTEEIFGGGACPSFEYAGPFTGFHLIESPSYDGLVGMYRWYLNDPINFSRSLRWTLEHGHANNFANNYASVVHWYQSPQVAPHPLPPAPEMLPPLGDGYEEARDLLYRSAFDHFRRFPSPDAAQQLLALCQAGAPLYRGDFAGALESLRRFNEGS
jgi:hypothetical protein